MGVNACATAVRFGPASQEEPWPAYLGSPARVSSRVDSVAPEPQPVWRVVVGRGIIGAPALGEDVVALSQAEAQVALLERATGDVIWRHRLGATASSGPLLADDRLFVATQTAGGTVYALRLSDGRELWSESIGDAGAPPAYASGAVYASTTRGWVVALDADRGHVRWRVRLPGAVRCAPLPVAGGIVVVTANDSLYLLDKGTGAVRVRRGTTGAVLAEPALAGGYVLIGMADELTALDTAQLAPAWSRRLGSAVVGSIAVLHDTAWALTQDGVLWTIPAGAAGAAAAPRRLDLGIVARAGPAPVPGGVYVVSVEGALTRLDAAGTRTWSVRLRPPVSEPVIADGRMLFAVSDKGEVVAFR